MDAREHRTPTGDLARGDVARRDAREVPAAAEPDQLALPAPREHRRDDGEDERAEEDAPTSHDGERRRAGRPNAMRNITLFPAACGEKKRITSSSKNVSPVAPIPTAYAAR